MPETHRLSPHDPLPDGRRHVVVLRRFAEDDPRRVEVEIEVVHGAEDTRLMRPAVANGRLLSFDEAIAEAGRIAEAEGFAHVYAVDRTAGPREQDIARHGGDHTVRMDQLEDTDEDDDERGPDMRDRHN